MELCLELGADVNAANSMGLTALLGAANRGSNDIIELLAEHGARLDVKDKEGRDAMRWAEGVFLAAVGAERKPATIALLEKLMAPRRAPAADARVERLRGAALSIALAAGAYYAWAHRSPTPRQQRACRASTASPATAIELAGGGSRSPGSTSSRRARARRHLGSRGAEAARA